MSWEMGGRIPAALYSSCYSVVQGFDSDNKEFRVFVEEFSKY